jgi:hypothetical protein
MFQCVIAALGGDTIIGSWLSKKIEFMQELYNMASFDIQWDVFQGMQAGFLGIPWIGVFRRREPISPIIGLVMNQRRLVL